MSVRGRISSVLGGICGVLLSVFGKAPAGTTGDEFRRADFAASTQRLGIRFGDRIREVFRFRWLRKV